MNGTNLDVTIFVPCYNESANITYALEVIRKAFSRLKLQYEIIVIDDCSTDDTPIVVQKYISNNSTKNVRIYKQQQNMGLAYNFTEAAFLGKGKYYRQVNGDADESEDNLIKLFSNLGRKDIIVPYHENATARGIPRRIISSLYTKIINFINGYSLKYYNGMAVYKRSDVMRWHSHSHGFGYQAELLTFLISKGRSYIEIPPYC